MKFKFNKNSSHVKNTGLSIFLVSACTLVLLPMLSRRRIIALPEWYNVKTAGIVVMIITILYSLFRLWADDFLKKSWRQRDYTPIAALVVATIVLIILL
jgi:UDP-N-acetylmuramyl pentapeptide phosphotransferase/UDP-N-acetylglucosamine-1-phosphate transferase